MTSNTVFLGISCCFPNSLGFVEYAGDRNRTYDPIITNDVLYQLSYSGAVRDSRDFRQE
jgi:hypothetical protein